VRRLVGGLVVAFLVAGAAIGLAPAHAAAWTSASYASRLVQLVDQARQQHGLGSLSVASGTSQVAASWTAHLDAAQSLSHNPDLRHQLETHGSADWTSYGENVGQGPAGDPDALFKAYMNSSEHRANILNTAYRFTGVAVVLDGDTAWNTFDFVDTYDAPKPAPAPAPPARPKPAPRPTSTTAASRPAPAPARAAVALPTTDVEATSRRLPHTDARPRADAPPSPAQLLGGRPARGARSPAVVLAASVRPVRPAEPAPSELVIAVAGLLLGFVGVRWWHLARAA
jgi:hypothetical protein